jgi:hypothetical protein
MLAMAMTTVPDAAAVLEECRRAVSNARGAVAAGSSDEGRPAVVVRVAEVRHKAAVVLHLRRLGYAVSDHFDTTLAVTGWDVDALQRRAERVERALVELRTEDEQVAGIAVALFRKTRPTCEDDAQAVARVMEHMRERARRRPTDTARLEGGTRHLYGTIPAIDWERADGEVRAVLVRVTLGERAMSKLAAEHGRLAAEVIGVFLESRDRRDA